MHGEDIVQAVTPYSKKIPWIVISVWVRIPLELHSEQISFILLLDIKKVCEDILFIRLAKKTFIDEGGHLYKCMGVHRSYLP